MKPKFKSMKTMTMTQQCLAALAYIYIIIYIYIYYNLRLTMDTTNVELEAIQATLWRAGPGFLPGQAPLPFWPWRRLSVLVLIFQRISPETLALNTQGYI